MAIDTLKMTVSQTVIAYGFVNNNQPEPLQGRVDKLMDKTAFYPQLSHTFWLIIHEIHRRNNNFLFFFRF